MSSRDRTRVAVMGAGSWGTAFATVLADAGCTVALWSHHAEQAAAINRERVNSAFFPDLVLPEMADLVGTGRSQVTRPLRMVHWREDMRTFAGHLKRGELKTMVRKAVSRVRAVIARSWSRS